MDDVNLRQSHEVIGEIFVAGTETNIGDFERDDGIALECVLGELLHSRFDAEGFVGEVNGDLCFA